MKCDVGRYGDDSTNLILCCDMTAGNCCPHSTAYMLGDLYKLDVRVNTNLWTNLTLASRGTPPTPRAAHGFVWVKGLLYVHGGYGLGQSVICQIHNAYNLTKQQKAHLLFQCNIKDI